MQKFINLHTHTFSDNSDYLEIVNQYPSNFDDKIPYFSIGIHPWKINQNEIENELKIIEHKLQFINCLALGECGIDKRIEIPINLQSEVFEKQILLAIKYNKPLIIHCVAAFAELISIKIAHKISVPIIIHGFSKNVIVANQLIDHGFYLSFGKYLMQNTDLQNVFQSVPIDKIFLETDSSTYSIEDIYKTAAKIKDLDLLSLQNQIKENFNRVFKL